MISIIIPTKNASKHIIRAVESVISQSEKDIEIIIINDASTDDTAQVLADLQKKDNRIHIITNQKNVGPGISRDIGIRQAASDYIAFIDDDDEWVSKEKLALQKKYLDEHPHVVIVGSAKNNFIREDGTPYPIHLDRQPQTDAEIRRSMLWRNPFITSSILLKKDAYLQAGGFAPMYLAEDYDLWMRMGQQGVLANILECDINYMVREGSASTTRQQEMNRVVISLIKKYKDTYPFFFMSLIKGYLRLLVVYIKHLL